MAFVCLNRPTTLLVSLVLTKPTNSRTAADSRLACIRRPFSSAPALNSSSPAGRSQFTIPFLTARSMAPLTVESDQGSRPEMLSTAPYTPPSWASHLHPAPSQFVSLGQVRYRAGIFRARDFITYKFRNFSHDGSFSNGRFGRCLGFGGIQLIFSLLLLISSPHQFIGGICLACLRIPRFGSR